MGSGKTEQKESEFSHKYPVAAGIASSIHSIPRRVVHLLQLVNLLRTHHCHPKSIDYIGCNLGEDILWLEQRYSDAVPIVVLYR